MPARPQTTARTRRTPRRAAAPGPDGGVRVTVTDRLGCVRGDRRWLAGVARRAASAIGLPRAEVGVTVIDDAAIAALHGTWLGVATPTDVITFDVSPPGHPGLHGDIVVSGETARRVAREVGWPARCELAYYVVHGLLHLAGEDDLTPEGRRRMRARERAVMRALGLPAPPGRRAAGRSGGRR